MTTLVVGATGATGRLLVEDLLRRRVEVRVMVRSPEKLSESLREHPALSVIQGNLLEMDDTAVAELVSECDAVLSCLGHKLTFRGVFGPPRRLVTDATRRLCEAIRNHHPSQPVKFVLMNTAGNRNRDLDEPISRAQRCVIGLLRAALPPHADNEEAADYLRVGIGQNDPAIEWVAVRPDGLFDADEVGEYSLHPSPTRSAIFDAGKTSRIQVAHFMAELITSPPTWKEWKGRMPVIYDRG